MEADRDIVIIGGGAAGLSAAQYAARANMKPLLIEEMASGGQALIIDSLENYPGFADPINGYEFSTNMENQAKKFGAEIMTTTVSSIEKKDDLFSISTGKGDITSRTVILATGAKHRLLGVQGEAEFTGRGVSYCATCDGPFFRNKKMFVVGGGDAACDEAMFLAKLTDNVVLVHRRDRFRAQKAVAARVMNNPNIRVEFNTVMKEINGAGKVEKVVLARTDKDETWEEETAAVFIFIGSDPQIQLVSHMVEKDEANYIVVNDRMETEVPGLFAAGDVRSAPFRQIVVAASDGAIAAHCAAQYVDEMKGNAYA